MLQSPTNTAARKDERLIRVARVARGVETEGEKASKLTLRDEAQISKRFWDLGLLMIVSWLAGRWKEPWTCWKSGGKIDGRGLNGTQVIYI
jgi:hypothetical protein